MDSPKASNKASNDDKMFNIILQFSEIKAQINLIERTSINPIKIDHIPSDAREYMFIPDEEHVSEKPQITKTNSKITRSKSTNL